MTTKTVYRYIRADKGTTVSTKRPTGECSELYRLIADEDCVLTNAEGDLSPAVDTETPECWSETEDLSQSAGEMGE